MRTKLTTIGLLLLSLLSLNAQEANLSPGQPFPSLTLPTATDHSALSTDSFLGKKSLVHFFASW
ncbi:hypothetical protein GCM10007100_22850 [Roseibacillus persicicus]|uniref:Redoxin domain-containing protein n=1 Tax=Roseibacillus persicicus TaxID=454148 RepID=A0A918WM21_9BACT|nr:hypothetical protein GCM10007100_22850 [Roseibacillus persicicus]